MRPCAFPIENKRTDPDRIARLERTNRKLAGLLYASAVESAQLRLDNDRLRAGLANVQAKIARLEELAEELVELE